MRSWAFWPVRRARAARWVLLLVAAATLCAGCKNLALAQYKDLTEVEATAPPARRCGECHQEQYREWSASAHAQSYASAAFHDSSDGYRVESCLACHVPQTILGQGPLRPRPARREEGVTCVACHFKEGRLEGPNRGSAWINPHPVGESVAFYRTSALCGTCHVETLRTWQDAVTRRPADRRTCQECHMPEVVRRTTQAEGAGFFTRLLVSLEKPVSQRRHNFALAGLADFKDAVDLAVVTHRRVAAGLELQVRVTNRLSHDIPTGAFGFRVARLEVAWAGADGATRPPQVCEFFQGLGTALRSGETRDVTVTLGPEATAPGRVVLRLTRAARGGANPLRIAERTVEVTDP